MNSKTNRRVLVLAFALSLILAFSLAIAPSFAFPQGGTWVGNCPTLQIIDTEGLSPAGRCSESNYELGICRDCALYNVGLGQAKGDCVTSPL